MTQPVAVDMVSVMQDYLAAQFATTRVVTELPGKLETAMPVVQIVPLGGPLISSLSHCSVSIQVYAANQPTSMALAVAVLNSIVMTMPKTSLPGVSVTGAKVNSLPQFWDYDNPKVRRTVSLIDIYCHPA